MTVIASATLMAGLAGCGTATESGTDGRAPAMDAGAADDATDAPPGIGQRDDGGGADPSPVTMVMVQNIDYPHLANHFSELKAVIVDDLPGTFINSTTICQGRLLTTEHVAGCEVFTCFGNPETIGISYAAVISRLVDGGSVTATDGSLVAEAIFADLYIWADHTFNDRPPGAGFLWQPGNIITVAGGGRGGSLGRFTASITFPPVVAASGVLAMPQAIDVAAAAPLPLAWTVSAPLPSDANDEVTVELLGQAPFVTPGRPWTVALCHASLRAGAFMVPPAVGARFEPNLYVNVTVWSDAETTVTAERDRKVTVVARNIIAQTVRFVP